MTVLPTVRGQLLLAADAQAAGAPTRPRWRRRPQRPLVARAGAVAATLSVAVALGVAALAVVLLHGVRRHSAHPTHVSPARLLSRPLHLPSLGPGGRCPTSTGYAVHNPYFVGTALGRGRVRVLLADEGGIRHGRVDIGGVRDGSMYGIQTLWYAMPDYGGPFVVRAARLGRAGRIEVQPGGTGLQPGTGPLIVPAGPTINTFYNHWRPGHTRDPATGRLVRTLTGYGYRTVPGSTWVKSPGCYAWQVDGRGFSEVIVFDAVRQRQTRSPSAQRAPGT